jgi:hypothetical protein
MLNNLQQRGLHNKLLDASGAPSEKDLASQAEETSLSEEEAELAESHDPDDGERQRRMQRWQIQR